MLFIQSTLHALSEMGEKRRKKMNYMQSYL